MAKFKIKDTDFYGFAEFQFNSAGKVSQIDISYMNAVATMALAQEQRVANLLAYFQLLPPGEESEAIELEIRSKLGLDG